MKKYISIILIVILSVLVLSVSAEEFTLRNGIVFEDSMEEVLSKETIPIAEKDTEFGDKYAENKYPYSIKTKEDTVAGISGTMIIYHFDKEKKLREVVYVFPNSKIGDFVDNCYTLINGGLVRKYGTPLGYTNGTCYVVTGDALESAAEVIQLVKMFGKPAGIRSYDEWIVSCNSYNVKIEQVEYYTVPSSYTYYHRVSYTYFSNDTIQNEMNSKQDQQDAIDNDL